jgi:hypothetical protein
MFQIQNRTIIGVLPNKWNELHKIGMNYTLSERLTHRSTHFHFYSLPVFMAIQYIGHLKNHQKQPFFALFIALKPFTPFKT